MGKKKKVEKQSEKKKSSLLVSLSAAVHVILVELVGLSDLVVKLLFIIDDALELIGLNGLDEHTSELTPARLVVLIHSHDTLIDLLSKPLLQLLRRCFCISRCADFHRLWDRCGNRGDAGDFSSLGSSGLVGHALSTGLVVGTVPPVLRVVVVAATSTTASAVVVAAARSAVSIAVAVLDVEGEALL